MLKIVLASKTQRYGQQCHKKMSPPFPQKTPINSKYD